MSHTYVLLELSNEAYVEIAEKLLAAGYQHAFTTVDGREVIDMHGTAVQADAFLFSAESSSFPWRTVSASVPEDGEWCWAWHTAWAQEEKPVLVHYQAERQQWWTDEGYLSTDQLTHWMPAQMPMPPHAVEAEDD